jgi:hypothetical protein
MGTSAFLIILILPFCFGHEETAPVFSDLRGSCLHIALIFLLDAFHPFDYTAVISETKLSSDFHIGVTFIPHLDDAALFPWQRFEKPFRVYPGADIFLKMQSGIGKVKQPVIL